MKITLLGTGDAIGTPKIGCHCPQCQHAADTGLMRLRTSLLVENGGRHTLIETSPDLRQQLLLNGSPVIDTVLWTHGHYDHFMGYGDFYRVQALPPVYAPTEVLDYGAGTFRFMRFSRHPVPPFQPFSLYGIEYEFVIVNHPPTYTCGVVIRYDGVAVGYTSDTLASIPPESRSRLLDLDLLLVDALVPPGFHISKHMNYRDACDFAAGVRARDFRCIHMSHQIPWDLPNTGRDRETFTW